MDARVDSTASGDRFRGQILLLRGRAGLTQRTLAKHLGISEQAIQKWEAGQGYPSPARLQALIALYLERGVFTAGREAEEATVLWEALRREAARHTPPFDAAWFARLRPAASVVAAGAVARHLWRKRRTAAGSRASDWGEAPDVARFQGRQVEVETLSRWLVEERCRVVAVLGLGGIGKTALASYIAHALAPHFAGLCWRSLRNAPPPEEWVAAAIGALAPSHPCYHLACRRGWRCCLRCCGSGAVCWCWTTWRRCWSQGRLRRAIGRGMRDTVRCCGKWARATIRALCC